MVLRPTAKLKDHPLSAVRGCLFPLYAGTLYSWKLSSLSATRGLTNRIAKKST
jgi:hypothetical protein